MLKFYEGGVGLDEARACSYKELVSLNRNAGIIAKNIKRALEAK